MEMNPVKYGIILTAMLFFLVGIVSGGFINDQVEGAPQWGSFGLFNDYQAYNLSDLINFDVQPFNLSDLLYPPETAPEVIRDPFATWEKVPLVLPSPSAISKEELFNSLTTESAYKKSAMSFMKSGYFFG